MAKVDIYTTVSSWPEALVYQRKMLNIFCMEQFNFIALVDTSPNPNPWNLWDSNLRSRAIEIANEYCDEVIAFPEELHRSRQELFPKTQRRVARYSNERVADALQFIYKYFITPSGRPSLIIDSDMFPIKPFEVTTKMKDFVLRGVLQTRRFSDTFQWKNIHSYVDVRALGRQVNYFWNGYLQLNASQMPFAKDFSFDCGTLNGLRVDTGGASHIWYSKMIEAKREFQIDLVASLSSLGHELSEFEASIPKRMQNYIMEDDRNVDGKVYCELYDGSFLHFRSGSNWREEPVATVLRRQSNFLKACSETCDGRS
jgi:hypothetical protein